MFALIVLEEANYRSLKAAGETIRKIDDLGGGDVLCRISLDETMSVSISAEGGIDVSSLPALDNSVYAGMPPLTENQRVLADAGRTPYKRLTTIPAIRSAMGARRFGRSPLRRL